MGTLGFEEYVEPLNLYLHKYREVNQAETLPLTLACQACCGAQRFNSCRRVRRHRLQNKQLETSKRKDLSRITRWAAAVCPDSLCRDLLSPLI